MIRDAFLKFATNQRPAATPGPLVLPYLFPDASFLDLKVATDIGTGTTLRARMDITKDFAGAAANEFGVCVVAHTNSTFVGGTIIASSERLLTTGLLKGRSLECVLPPISTATGFYEIGGDGLRYLTVGALIYVPSTDWTDGEVSACLQLDTDRTHPTRRPVGYEVL